MEVIRDKNGNVVQRSKNLAGIRRYVCGFWAPIIKTVAIDHIGPNGWEGQLSILFENGHSFQADFADFSILADFIRRWRNVHGAPFLIDGKDAGTVSSHHPALI